MMVYKLEFDRDGNLITFVDLERGDNGQNVCKRFGYIPARHVKLAYENLKAGKPWWMASPAHHLTRVEAAFILAEGGSQ